jgi:CRISPR-associated endonuclease Csn1
MKKYTLNTASATTKSPQESATGDLQFAFDVGHSSIGWAVLQSDQSSPPNILGTGVVIFPADDCLASQRRAFRRQRRHIRATRQRISRIERILLHLGVMSEEFIARKRKQGGGHSAPWLLASRILRGGPLLTWEELWDVLRWYAHNRGYDGNRAWSAYEIEADREDTEKVERAKNLLSDFEKKFGRQGSMAEVFCDISGLDPLGTKISCNLPGEKRPKGLNAAFPREDVEREVRTILEKHIDKLPNLDTNLITALMEDWTVLPCDSIRLPARYGQILANGKRSPGGLLFGQLIPRFENRIISTCPITFERVFQRLLAEGADIAKAKHEAAKLAKVPAKDCPEFLHFRWVMQIANIQVATGEGRKTRSLSVDERKQLDSKMRERGFFTSKQFKDAVRTITGGPSDNIDQMLTHPDAEKALVLDPARKAISRTPWDTLLQSFSAQVQKRAIGRLRRGKSICLGSLFAEDAATPDGTIENFLTAFNSKKGRKENPITSKDLLATTVRCEALTGRAPYSRAVMKEVTKFVLTTDRHPTEEGGPLYRSETIRKAQLERAIDEQTNNHLVRHRLLILERLHRDILREYSTNDPSRIARVTIEVNRDLRELSGKTAKEVAQDIGQRLSNFKSVTARLEKAFAGKNIRITPGLIRKARIAEDLGWKCPYTGKDFDEFDLLYRKVDKDHIIPRSERASDSLDSLVITFSSVNKMKGKRTAALFIEEEQSKPVPDMPNVEIRTLTDYKAFVEKLETFKGHDDDKRRKKRRREMLQLRDYVEKEFTPRDLTQTSQLVRLGAQILERAYAAQDKKPVIISLPGSVTGAVRKSWNLLGCLATANPLVINNNELDEHGKPKIHNKTDIRGITHLHHALDACVLALTSRFFPRDGGVWELLVKRRLNSAEQASLKARIGSNVEFTKEGEIKLAELPSYLKEQVRLRLAERRVVQHQPSDLSGMECDQTVWRVFDPEDSHLNSKRLGRWLAGRGVTVPSVDGRTVVIISRKRKGISGEKSSAKNVLRETKTWIWSYDIKDKTALVGLEPSGYADGAKLRSQKAVKILGNNFGISLDPEPTIIRPFRIWHQIAELSTRNGGKPPRILRIGSIIQVKEKTIKSDYRGVWMVRGVQLNQRSGYLLDLSPADHITYRGVDGCFQQVSLATILKCGLEMKMPLLTGIPATVLPKLQS